jgi:hypothetical protein
MIENIQLKIFATILHLFSVDIEKAPDYRKPEELCDNLPRLEIMSKAIVKGTNNNLCSNTKKGEICWSGDAEKLSFIMTIMARKESGFLERIHAGNCWVNECDPVFKYDADGNRRLAYHRARTPWQLHKTIYVKDKEWNQMVGTDLTSTIIAATVASRVFAFSRNRCKTEYGAFSLYATGKRCSWSGAADRVFSTRKYMGLAKDPEWVQEKLELADKCKQN